MCSFLLQVSAFVSVMSLDARRQRAFRVDLACCFKLDKSELPDVRHKDSILLVFMKKIWTKYIVLHRYARPFWVCSFVCMAFIMLTMLLLLLFVASCVWVDILWFPISYSLGRAWSRSKNSAS